MAGRAVLNTRSLYLKPNLYSFFKGYINNWALFLMFVPGIVFYIIFKYIPMYGILISFKEYRLLDGIMGSPWIGFKYYEMLMNSPDFWRSFRNTVIISGMKLALGFPAPIILALLLNEVRNLHFKRTVQTISYLPHFLSWVVMAGVVMNLLSPSTGVVNIIIKVLGGNPIYFLASNSWFRQVVIVTDIWKKAGWDSIIYLAALAGVNIELYESAYLDGANRLKQTIHITLPAITQVIVIMFILAVGDIVKDDFDQIYNLYNAAVYKVGDVLSTYIYRMGVENSQFSFSAAAGLFKNLIAFVLVLATNQISRRFSEYGLW